MQSDRITYVQLLLVAYWKHAGHCCDPDETAGEITAALESAGFLIVPRRGLPLTETQKCTVKNCTCMERCIHPGVFARGPVPGTEHCWTCDRDISRTEL